MKRWKKFGDATVPDGRSGPWTIDTFTISEAEARRYNIFNMRTPFMWIDPGTYRRLRHDSRGVVMSNTPMEVRTNQWAYCQARGRVIVNGLGLGMFLEGILQKPEVTYVRVIELDEHVIRLVGPHFRKDPRVEIIQGDAYTYCPARGETFDFAWHDIWDDINADNLPSMAKLGRKYNKRVAAEQMFWSRDIVRDDVRRNR
jgi:hypothetical protein